MEVAKEMMVPLRCGRWYMLEWWAMRGNGKNCGVGDCFDVGHVTRRLLT